MPHRPWMPRICVFYPSTSDVSILFMYMSTAMRNKQARVRYMPDQEVLARATDTIIHNMMENCDE